MNPWYVTLYRWICEEFIPTSILGAISLAIVAIAGALISVCVCVTIIVWQISRFFLFM